MPTELNIILNISSVLLGFIFGWFITEYINWNNKKENKKDVHQNFRNLDNIKIIIGEKYFDRINELIDSFIQNAIDNYTVFALSSNSNHYLNEKETEIMTKYVFGSVKRNMTADVIEVIKTVYTIGDDEKRLNDLLNVRIKLHMINFIREYNSLPEDIPNVENIKK